MSLNNTLNIQIDDEQCFPRNRPLNYDDWVTWYSNDLLNLWMGIVAYTEDSLKVPYILDNSDFNIFCNFCYENSCKMRSPFPS